MSDADDDAGLSRRDLLRHGVRGAAVLGLAGVGGAAALEARGEEVVWQIDPDRCVWCGQCATECVLTPSAVKCMRDQAACGYCEICTGYQAVETIENREQAENQLCPTHAITRKLPPGEYPYYEYVVDEEKCIGCAKCAEGCTRYGNGSMYMQVDHDYCVNCAECAIAVSCPSDAFVRVSTDRCYYFKHRKEFPGLSPWKDYSTKDLAREEAKEGRER